MTWVRTSFLLKAAAAGVPPPNESFFELLGDQRFRIWPHLGWGVPTTHPTDQTRRENFHRWSWKSLMAPWKRFFAKVAKSFKNQCETEGAGSHQSLWKPFRFWFGSLTFWTEVLALQSVTSWCQNFLILSLGLDQLKNVLEKFEKIF